MSESVTLLVASQRAGAIEAVKARRFIGFHPRINFDFGDINSEARLENRSQSEFFNRFRKIPNFDMIQYVEYYW
jgi:hypothetical protein